MEQLSSMTRHIPRGENHWIDLLSWFRSVPRVGGDPENAGARVARTRATVVNVPARFDSSMQSKGETRDGQDVIMEGQQKIETLLGTAVRGQDDVYLWNTEGCRCYESPDSGQYLHARLMVCANDGDIVLRGRLFIVW